MAHKVLTPSYMPSTLSFSRRNNFYTGTSNVVLPEPNKKAFPPAFQSKTHLEYYASLFNSVEINRTFYKLPMPATMEKWAMQVPEAFRFTVKLWRDITHVKELCYKPEDVKTFMQTVAPVGPKKGCLLIQFPAGLGVQYAGALESLLKDITALNREPGWRLAVEFRNRGWYLPGVLALLERYRAGWVLHDMPMKGAPAEIPEEALVDHTDFVFKRYHGLKGDYKGSYPPEILEKEAVSIKAWLHQGKDVYAYFNNTVDADAPGDAQMLRQFVES